LGRHPETGEIILAGIGRFGAYIKHGPNFKSLAADDDVLTIGLNRAVVLLAEPAAERRQGPTTQVNKGEKGESTKGREGGRHARARRGRSREKGIRAKVSISIECTAGIDGEENAEQLGRAEPKQISFDQALRDPQGERTPYLPTATARSRRRRALRHR